MPAYSQGLKLPSKAIIDGGNDYGDDEADDREVDLIGHAPG